MKVGRNLRSTICVLLIGQFCKTWLETMLTLIVSRGQHGKTISNRSLDLGSFFSNMVFQNEYSESSQIQIHYMSPCQNFVELTPTPRTDNLLPIYRSSSNIAPRKRYPNKDVKRRSSICNNNGRIMNPKHRRTFWHTIRHNTNNTNFSIKCSSPTKSLQTCKIKICIRKTNTKKQET